MDEQTATIARTAAGTENASSRSLAQSALHQPLTVFTGVKLWLPDRIGTLAVFCSDGRWAESFDEFLRYHLQSGRYDRLVIPGGPAWLTTQEDQSDFAQAAREQLDFLVHVHKLDRIVLMAHYGCAVYTDRMQRDADECLPMQVSDLRSARDLIRRWYPSIGVDSFLAMRRDTILSFEQVYC